MITKNEIMSILKEKKDKFNIKTFVLFGSFANGSYHKNSDVDIAYILEDNKRLDFDTYIELENELEKNINLPIDIMNFKNLNPLVKLHSGNDFIYV